MQQNMGTTDKVIRIVIAALLAVLYFTNVITGTFGTVLLVVAAILLITTITGFCGLYKLFGINTCPIKEKKG